MAESENATKKGPFDNLDRDELIKKCKGLLTICKQAKQAKDDLQEENSRLKELLNNNETQKTADKQCLSAMQEIVSSLTEYKLSATTKIDELENSLSKLRHELNDSQTIVIENESLKRQIKRLTDENEELLSDQQALESQIQNSASDDNNSEMKQLSLKLETIQQELNNKNEYIAKLEKDTTIEREQTTNQYKNQSKKLSLYKTKILEVAGKLKQLKKGKEILSCTVDDYSKAVSKWQMEIVTVSSKLIEKIHLLQKEKNELKLKNSQLEENNRLQLNELSNLNKINANTDLPSFDYQQKLNALEEDNINKTEQLKMLQEKLLEHTENISACNEFKVNCDNALLSNKNLKFELNSNLMELEKKNKQLADIQHQIHKEFERISSDNSYKMKYDTELQSHKTTESNLKEKIICLENENQEKSKQIECINQKLQEITNNYMDLEVKYNESIMNNENLEMKYNESIMNNEKIQNNNDKNEKELENLREKLQQKCTEILQIESLSNKLESNEIELRNVQQTNIETSNQLKTTKTQLDDANEQIKLLKNKSEDCVDSAKTQCSNLQKQLNIVKNELAEKLSSLSITKTELENQTEIVMRKSKEITELLEEMRELNDALKNRGDVISKQKSKINEFEIDIERQTKRITELELICNEKNLEITKLVSDLDKSNINNDNMSTSTISKLDETNRMRDIEDCFEEKYNKLRALAIKLKKKVAEQSAHIIKLESKNTQNSDEGIQITSKLGAIEVQVKNLQSLQHENDSLQDRIEQLMEEKQKTDQLLADLNGKIEAFQSDACSLETKNDNFKSNLAEQNKIKIKLDQAIQEYQTQVQGLKAELNSTNILLKEMNNEVNKLKDEISTKDKEISTKTDEATKLTNEITRVKASMKSTNVLNLEMEAYEKSLNEVSQKLDTKLAEITDLNSIIKSHENTIESVKNQIKVLEVNLESEKTHSIELKQQLDIQQMKLKENEHDKSELKIKLDTLTKENQQIKQNIETIRLDTEQFAMDREKIVHALQIENEKNARTICSLTDDLLAVKDKLIITEQELIDVKTEFINYKVRAQSVLRQNQTKDTSRESELEDELVAANSLNESLNNKLTQSLEKISKIELLCNDLQKEKDRLDGQCTRYSTALKNLETETRLYTNGLISDKEVLEQDKKKLSTQLRIQMDVINEYKKKIIELEECQRKLIEETRSQKQIQINTNHHVSLVSEVGQLKMLPSTDEQKVEFLLMERQEGEGADSTSSGPSNIQRKISTTKSRRDLIPLDELLNTPFDDQNINNDMDISQSPTIELQRLKDKLYANETRVKHLTILLAEAEQDLVKLTQLNDVLKEEMRRNERSTEREQHLHNLEYLKNVVFKFLTINCGDEKCHLVPVLNTILKLSPDEVNKLQSFAKGESSSKGWTNYLPTWKNNNT